MPQEACSPLASPPFADFAGPAPSRGPLRRAITATTRRPEPACVADLLPQAGMIPTMARAVADTARVLIEGLRSRPMGRGVDGLIHEYSLSSREGIALMCLAEALLRIPDTRTRDALIRDKIAGGDWRAHLGHDASLFVNAATWGLLITGTLTRATAEGSLSSVLTKLIAKGGEPLIRRSVDFAIRLMGERFVTGQTIAEALGNARTREAKGFQYSYDMLGEAALTAADSERYFTDYLNAIHAIGEASGGRGIYAGPGISIKLSALHPRYGRAQAARVRAELLPRLRALAALARQYDIGLNIDAEESDRLELSLDLLDTLCGETALAGWNGLGFVVQAYGKRCPLVLDHLIDLARRSGRRLMVRLVKGAYWDQEIKRAQVDGQSDYPVFTRKVHTDLSYLACARKMLDAPDALFPQFATHNAQTLASLYHLAGPDFHVGQYEFQCLHGMGEALYDEVVERLERPCRIYAPVGTHETLLAYLVRRLLENGANSSFVNRVADKAVPIADLITAPDLLARTITPLGAPHDLIAHPARLFGAERLNSAGLDLADEDVLHALGRHLENSAARPWLAAPLLAGAPAPPCQDGAEPVRNPADHREVVGNVIAADTADIPHAFAHARAAIARWGLMAPRQRAECLNRAAELMAQRMPELMGLVMREAGKSAASAVAELREAIDFLRYYAAQSQNFDTATHRPLGVVVCISPWNFPLAIFIGQVAAALAAGNAVLAKPAEETPLVACAGARILHEAGVPEEALQVLPGDGRIGAALVAHAQTAGVMFTGSTQVARLIQAQLANRLSDQGRPLPLIAETGGQNVMIVDSSALTEQVVGDVLASAFDSAGQRCSALRVLCLQHDVADKTLIMLKGAMAELRIGAPTRLDSDVGPVISAEAQDRIRAHIRAMRAKGCVVHALDLPPGTENGTFVAPTLIEIDSLTQLDQEVFGPVLHVLRYRRDELDSLINAINATGYGLTFGLHTRIDATIDTVSRRIDAGNLYINRNTIGAVVGVQPFGGRGLSGTGPKAGGPLALYRLLAASPGGLSRLTGGGPPPQAAALRDWLRRQGLSDLAEHCAATMARSRLGLCLDLPGPVGERNTYALHPRGRVLALSRGRHGLIRQLCALFATGNHVVLESTPDGVVLESTPDGVALVSALPPDLARHVSVVSDWTRTGPYAAILTDGQDAALIALAQRVAALDGPIACVHVPVSADGGYCLDGLLEERTLSVNTAAAGGNASLVSIG